MTAADRLSAREDGAGRRPWRGLRAGLPWSAAPFWAGIAGAGAVSGLVYALVAPRATPLVGMGYGALIAVAVMLFERGIVGRPLRDRLRRAPWVLGILGTEFAYLGFVMAGRTVAGLLFWAAGVADEPLRVALAPDAPTLVYSLLASGVVITLIRMRDLIGADVFRNVVLGRYYHPVEEERIFLFVDLIGSTAYAQAHGDLRAQAFLSAIFADLAGPVRRHGGTVDDYVGDMALITWKLEAGVRDGACLRCVFDFLAEVEAGAEGWLDRFGQVPRFRAALHGGSVVTAEVGADRRKIAYFGDVVNTTGRLEALSRTLDAEVLASADLLDRIPVLPEGVVARPLGAHAVKGRGGLLRVLALLEAPRAGAAA